VSGPEKSRQCKHEAEDGCAWVTAGSLGLVLCTFDRSGRDDRGIGGGAPLVREAAGLGVLPFVPLDVP